MSDGNGNGNGLHHEPRGAGGAAEISRSEAQVIERMIRTPRWATAALKTKLVEKMDQAFDWCKTARDVSALGKVITTMEAQNQVDEHSQQMGGKMPTKITALKVEFDS